MKKFYIRRANENDVEIINKLFEKLLLFESLNYDKNIKNNVKIDSFFNKKIIEDDVIILVALINKVIVGYIYGNIDYDNKVKIEDEAYINSLYVEESYRNNGIGKRLLSEFINIVRNNNVKYINIDNFYDNDIAKSLYEKMGFNNFKECRRKEL